MRLAHEVNHTDVSEFTIVATYLPLKKWRYIIPFLRMSGRIEKQVKKNSGVVRYGVRTDFTKKRFWTYSVWKSSEEMRHFVPLEPHGTAIKKFVKWETKVRPSSIGRAQTEK